MATEKVISKVTCDRNNCKNKNECLVFHAPGEDGKNGTFFPALTAIFNGQLFVNVCQHFEK